MLSGIVLYHSKYKKELYYISINKTADYLAVTIAFKGKLKHSCKIRLQKKI